MPELAGIVVLLCVESIFKLCIPLSQLGKEGRFVWQSVEVEGFSGAEDDDLLGEVAVMGVI